MNDRDGDVSVRELNYGPENALVNLGLPQECEHLSLCLQKGMDDSLDVHQVEGETLSKRRDLNFAVTDRVGLGRRATNLVLVSGDRGLQGGEGIDRYLIEVSGANVLYTPIRGSKLSIVVNVARVPYIRKVKEDIAVG